MVLTILLLILLSFVFENIFYISLGLPRPLQTAFALYTAKNLLDATALTGHCINLLKRPRNIKIYLRFFPKFPTPNRKWQIWGGFNTLRIYVYAYSPINCSFRGPGGVARGLGSITAPKSVRGNWPLLSPVVSCCLQLRQGFSASAPKPRPSALVY